MDYLDEAQRRIDTGWRIEYTPECFGWCVSHTLDEYGNAHVLWFKTEAEALAAYLAVTKEGN